MNWEVSTMPSKRSFFNGTLFRKNLTRFWPLWGGVSLMGAVFPLYLLLSILGRDYLEFTDRDVTMALYSVVTWFIPAFLLVYAALCGVLVWGYLNNSRSVGLYHSLPVDRRCLYLTTLASGFAMVLIPFVVVGALLCLVCLVTGTLPLLAVAETALAVVLMAVFYFSTATLAAMVTGNSFAMLAFYAIGHFLAVLLESLVTAFASGFLFGLTSLSAGVLNFLSPTIYIYEHFKAYYGIWDASGPDSLQGMWVIAVYALAGLVLLALSWLLYRRRKSESAGDVVAQGWLQPVFRYGVALCSALTLGQFLYEMLYGLPFQVGPYYSMLPMALCMIFTGILGYYAASMLLKKSLKVFRGDWQGPVTVAAMVVIFCGCVSFDALGTASYVPRAEEVESVTVTSAVGYSLELSGDSDLAAQVMALHQSILREEDYIRAMTDQWYEEGRYWATVGEMDMEYVHITYLLTNGDTVHREYPVVLVKDRWYNQPDTFDYQTRETLCGPAAAMTTVTPRYGGTVESVYGYLWNSEAEDVSLAGDEARAVYSAVLEDAAAGRLYHWEPFADDEEYELIGSLEFAFQPDSPPSDSGPSDTAAAEYISTDLYAGMTSTLQALRDLGWNDGSLVDPEAQG